MTSAPVFIVNANDAPAGDFQIIGAPLEGVRLSVEPDAITDADGKGPAELQWQRGNNGVFADIQGATTRFYTPDDIDVATQLRVVCAYTDQFGTQEILTTAAVTIENENDTPSGALPLIRYVGGSGGPAPQAVRGGDVDRRCQRGH